MKTLSPTEYKTATVVVALAGLFGTTSAFAGRASGVSTAELNSLIAKTVR